MKTVLFTDGIMHEDDHPRRSSSVVPRDDYQALAQLIPSGTRNATCQRTFSFLQLHEIASDLISNHSAPNHNH